MCLCVCCMCVCVCVCLSVYPPPRLLCHLTVKRLCHITKKMVHFGYKSGHAIWVSEVFKRRLAYNVAVIIAYFGVIYVY